MKFGLLAFTGTVVACSGSPLWLGGADPALAVAGSSNMAGAPAGGGVANTTAQAGDTGAGGAVGVGGVAQASGGTAPVSAQAGASGASGASGAAGAVGVPDPSCPPLRLATGARTPTYIAVDDDGVFWSETGHAGTGADPNGIWRAAKDGSSASAAIPVSGSPGALALDTSYVYYIQNATPPPTGYTVLRSAKPGKPPSQRGYYALFASPAPTAGAIAVDAADVFWVDAQNAYAAPIEGATGAWTSLANPLTGAADLVLDGTALWIGERTGDLLFLDWQQGLAPAPVPATTPSFGVAINSRLVFWSNEAAIFGREKSGGSTVETVASCATACDAVVSDGALLFWATTHEIWEAPTTGGAARLLANGYADVRHLALDSTRVYWTDSAGGTVWSTCK